MLSSGQFYMPTFRTLCLFQIHRRIDMKMEQTVCSETLALKIQKQKNYPEESINQFQLFAMTEEERRI